MSVEVQYVRGLVVSVYCTSDLTLIIHRWPSLIILCPDRGSVSSCPILRIISTGSAIKVKGGTFSS